MRIEINSDYALSSDSVCWTLVKKGVWKTGKKAGHPRQQIVGYYSRLSDAVTALADRGLRESSATTLNEALSAAQTLADDIRRALTPTYRVELDSDGE